MKICLLCQIEQDFSSYPEDLQGASDLSDKTLPYCNKCCYGYKRSKTESRAFCLIYLLTNTKNGLLYVGQSWLALYQRIGTTGGGYANSPRIYSAIQEFGVDVFEYKVLTVCYDQVSANYLEILYQDQYNTLDPAIGYNVKRAGSHGAHAESTKQQISETLKKQAAEWTPEERIERAAPISTYWLGKERGPHSEERKDVISTRITEWHANNEHPMQGQHHTEETKTQMSKANKGRKRTPESIEKGRQARTKTEHDQAIIEMYQNNVSIKKIGETFGIGNGRIYRTLDRHNIPRRENFDHEIGKKRTDETKALISQIKQEWWNEKKGTSQ
jgi:group I intron endonuclease